MIIYFVRHGQTPWNEHARRDSRGICYFNEEVVDPRKGRRPEWDELSETGRAQAERVAMKLAELIADEEKTGEKHLETYLFHSPLPRVIGTARPTAEKLRLELYPTNADDRLLEYSVTHDRNPVGARARLNEFIDEKVVSLPTDSAVLVFSHGLILMQLLSYYTRCFDYFMPAPAQIIAVEVSRRNSRTFRGTYTEHLMGL